MSSETPLQLRMRVLQLRMEYLKPVKRTKEEEEKLLADLESAVAKLNAAGATGEVAGGHEPGADRRAEPRANVSFPVVLRLTRPDGTWHQNISIARDVARHGISIVAAFDPPVGEKLTIDVGLPTGKRLTNVAAEVRWKTAVWTHPGHFVLGLRFHGLPPDAQAMLAQVGG